MKSSVHQWFMSKALDEAYKAYHRDEVPVGVVLVDAKNQIIAEGHNEKEKTHDPCGHAEIITLRKSGELLKNWRLQGCSLYVTLEPCPMCLAAMVHARIEKLIFGAYDNKGGAIGLAYNLHRDARLNHTFSVIGGVRHYECSKLISLFFKKKRSYHSKDSQLNTPKHNNTDYS